MAELEGYLQIRDPYGNCTEILNSCRTLAFLENSNSGFRQAQDCDTCCCPDIDDCEYTTVDGEEPAPWYDPLNPASTEFFGLWGSLNIAQPEPQDGIVPPKTMTFTGVLLSSTKRGKVYGADWLSTILTPFCVSCAGREATVYAYCAGRCDDEEDEAEDPLAEEPVEDEPNILDISNIFDADGCEIDGADAPLTAAPELEALVDSGQRDLLRIQYVAGSFQELEADFPDCYGCRVTFQFILPDTESFLDGDPICEISPAEFTDGIDVPCKSICIGEPVGEFDSCGACGIKCECDGTVEVSVVDSATSNTLPDGAAECRYSAPLLCKRYACLIDSFAYLQAAPVVSIYAGSQDMENVSISFYQAATGLPNPMTAQGAEIYATRQPESTALITRIPAGTTLTLDGRDSTASLDCPGFARQSASPLVSGCDNKKYRHPRLCCGFRFWVVVEVDCYTTTHDDWRLTGAVHGIERT